MRSFVLLAALAFLGSQEAGAVAIKLSGNSDPSCNQQYICVTGPQFSITTNDSGGGFFDTLNQQGMNITALNFDLLYSDPGCATGGPDAVQLSFGNTFAAYDSQYLSIQDSSKCTGNQIGGVLTAEYKLALGFQPGVPNNFLFQIDLTDAGNGNPQGAGGWLPDTTFQVTTSQTPEPATYGLMALGVGALCLVGRRKLLRS